MATSPRTPALLVVLVWAMVSGTVLYPALAVLASALLDDLGLTASGFGLLVFSFSAVSAMASPFAGGIADRLGGRRSVIATFVLTGTGFLAVAASPTLGLLTASTIVVAGGQALMNPATNRLIRDHTVDGRRGAITGVKQSGVYVGYVLAGALAPAVAASSGWRSFFVATGVVLLVGAPTSWALLPPDTARTVGANESAPAMPRWVWVLAGYGFLMGTASSSGTFLPLFAETDLGFTPVAAGLLTSFLGVIAIGTRILGARAAERGRRYRTALSVAAGTGVLFAIVALLSPSLPPLIWVASVAFALGLSAWNAIGMLAVIDLGGPLLAGAATGRVLLGFLMGLAVGPLVFGQAIDGIGFAAVWIGSGALAAAAFGVARLWRPVPA